MLIFDQLKKNDPHLRWLVVMILAGLFVLLCGLWWVQIVSARDYRANLESQSLRTIRVPAVRGKILDRNGAVLAENRPVYNVSIYLDELRKSFDAAATQKILGAKKAMQQRQAQEQQRLGRELTKQEKKPFVLSAEQRTELRKQARYEVTSNVVAQIGERIQTPLFLSPTNFHRHYKESLALPCPVATNLGSVQIARFEELCSDLPGAALDMQSARVYTNQSVAAHLLGYVRQDDSSALGEEASFSYRLPDYRGLVGIEAGYDKELRGKAGAKSILVNSLNYRQNENNWSPAEAGQNVVLTIDLHIQQAAERALRQGSPAPGLAAAVVMDVGTGDVLALASIPTFNPNHFIQGFPPGEYERIADTNLNAQINRATQGGYAPGSIFKTIVGLAALEAGVDANASYYVEPDPQRLGKGCIYVGKHKRKIEDQAPPGEYNFRRALKLSSNAYFITNGLRVGVEKIVRLGQRLHLGEKFESIHEGKKTGLMTRQEIAGEFPTLSTITSGWFDGHTANVCIGQDPIIVTPLQMAVMTCAIANGGKVLCPRLVDRIEPQYAMVDKQAVVFPRGRVRDQLGVSPRNLAILKEAMLADVEDGDGTGRQARLADLRICGKTGTAQVKDPRGHTKSHNVWFISFAPYENPRYAVVVMVEGGSSGGGDCAPIARNIYQAILERERAVLQAQNLTKRN
jgi:penicillin-binding protein 2